MAIELRFGSENVEPHPVLDRRPPGAGRAAVVRLGGEPAATGHGAEGGAAQRADAQGALPCTHRLDPRGGDDLAAGRARRRAQLGLPVLLAPGRGDVRARPRRPRLAGGGRGAPALGGRVHRPHRRAPGATASALHGRRDGARARGRDRHAARLRRIATGARRQRRQPADPARRLRPDHRSARSRRRSARIGAQQGLAGASRRWCTRSSDAGTSPTTASGRPGCRPVTTSTRR